MSGPAPGEAAVAAGRAELARAQAERVAVEAEAGALPTVLRALLAVRRARSAGLTPGLDRLHRQVEELVERARSAMAGADIIRGAVDRLRAAGHGDLADATPALARALDQEARVRRRLRVLLAEHLPQALPGDPTVDTTSGEAVGAPG